MLPGVLQPRGQMIEGVPPGDVIDQQRSRRSAVVGARDGAEGLLPGRVPDLQFDLFAIDGDHARPKLHSDCQVMDRLEAFIGKLQQQTRLSNA